MADHDPLFVRALYRAGSSHTLHTPARARVGLTAIYILEGSTVIKVSGIRCLHFSSAKKVYTWNKVSS